MYIEGRGRARMRNREVERVVIAEGTCESGSREDGCYERKI